MAKLKDRNKQIPGGLRFRQSETGWDSTTALYNMPSLRVLSEAVLAHRRGNTHLANVHGWRMTLEEIEDEVDAFNAQICVDHGWMDYVYLTTGEQTSPKLLPPQPKLPSLAGKLVAGAKTLVDMMGPQGPVKRNLAEERAAICVACPENAQGDWTRFFTQPASEMIRSMISKSQETGLKTASDDKLRVCQICACPLKLKVHAQLAHIKKHMDSETFNALPENCWIKNER